MSKHLDAIIVGAGFSGMYMLHKLREQGLSAKVLEAGAGVGGVWYFSRYPGARCDSESYYYCLTFSEELYNKWTWSSRYSGQEEILAYLNFVADELNLRPDIQLNTRVQSAKYDEIENIWRVKTADGEIFTATYFITGVGCLSTSNMPKIKGNEQFKGEMYHTGEWPHEPVDMKGKRVGVIGTGSSGVQAIPVIAEEAAHVYVFQRTPQYTSPAHNVPMSKEETKQLIGDYAEFRERLRNSTGGFPYARSTQGALEVSEQERNEKYEKAWNTHGLFLSVAFKDLTINPEANETLAQFVRDKIKDIVKDEETSQKLMPSYYFGTKRPIVNTNYYETYNRDNVTLVDLRESAIQEITPNGILTGNAEYELDIIVFATGYDAMTGTLLKLDIEGRNGMTLREKWQNGAATKTYLGLAISDFPNMFTITGPQSPSVISNMPVSIEQHVDWITDCIVFMKEHNIEAIEATPEAEISWGEQCRNIAEQTLFVKTDSWYTGSNVEGKTRDFLIYLGGLQNYRNICDDIASNNYEGFNLVVEESKMMQ